MQTDDSGDAALRREIRRLRHALARAEREATVDALTGCLNRRGWTETLRAEERRCSRHGLDALVIIVDLDGLKAINDTEGNDAGDRCLIGCCGARGRGAPRGGARAAGGGAGSGLLPVPPPRRAPDAIVAHLARAL